MKHIRTFEKYRLKNRRYEIIKESVIQVNDVYKVKTMIDIPQSLINAYVKKVKDTTGKNLRQFFGDVDIAEEVVKYINTANLDVDNIPGNAIMGGELQPDEAQMIDTQVQPQAQVQQQAQPQAQVQQQAQPQAQPQVQVQAQPQTQVDMEFEDPQAQAQDMGEVQFEDPQAQGEEDEEDEEDEENIDDIDFDDESLPL